MKRKISVKAPEEPEKSYRPLLAAFMGLIALGGLVLVASLPSGATGAMVATTPLVFGLPIGIAITLLALIASFGNKAVTIKKRR